MLHVRTLHADTTGKRIVDGPQSDGPGLGLSPEEDAMRAVDAAKTLELASALPARYYFGEDMLAMEQRSVFARSWQLVAHQSLRMAN